METIGKKYFDIFSDHRPVRARIKITEKLECKIRAKSNHKNKAKECNKDLFLLQIEQHDWSIKYNSNINDDYEYFVKQLIECKKHATLPLPNNKRNRLSSETLDLLKKRKELKSTNNDSEYKKLCKQLRTKIKDDYDNYRKIKLQETVHAKLSLKKLEKEINLKQSIPVALINNNGERKTKRNEI